MKPKIVVIGSANTDQVVEVERLPRPGETVLGHTFVKMQGGKGANQAVAATRLGAEVTLVCRLGKDAQGEEAFRAYQAEGLHTDYITWDELEPSGGALIMVDRGGENMIAVIPGANRNLSPQDVRAAEQAIKQADCVLLQLEIPIESVEAGIKLANQHGVMVILNPAPAMQLPQELLKQVDVLTPNQTEAKILTGRPLDQHGGESWNAMKEMGLPKNVVITRGAEGAMILGDRNVDIPSYTVNSIDSTGAGDAFNGGLAFALSRGDTLNDAVRYANAVGALATTKIGAQSAMPSAAEVEQLIKAVQ